MERKKGPIAEFSLFFKSSTSNMLEGLSVCRYLCFFVWGPGVRKSMKNDVKPLHDLENESHGVTLQPCTSARTLRNKVI